MLGRGDGFQRLPSLPSLGMGAKDVVARLAFSTERSHWGLVTLISPWARRGGMGRGAAPSRYSTARESRMWTGPPVSGGGQQG